MNNTISDRLIEAMRDRRISLTDLSRETGIDKSSISRYRRGEYSPSKDNLFDLAYALGVNPEWLAGKDVPKLVSSTFQGPRFSEDEQRIIWAYRSADPDIQHAIRLMLKVTS